MDLYKRLYSNCIYQGIIEGVETKEKAINDEISNLNNKIWPLFSELMNEDCLNSAKPGQFLPIKNLLKIKLLDETNKDATENEASVESNLNKQLLEAFADVDSVAPMQPP